jgi:hypothetical protein
MRLILEKSEIVAILGKHFDVELDPEKVLIRTDPLEIEVCGLPMADAAKPKEETNVVSLRKSSRAAVEEEEEEEEEDIEPKALARQRDDPDASDEPPPPGNDGIELSNDSVHPASVLAASKALEHELDRKNPQLARRSGRWSSIAPTDSKDEIE